LARLRAMASRRNKEGMARFGIRPTTTTLGISIWELRRLKREIGTDHRLAQQLWASKIHEARILASFIEDPARVTSSQMERWVKAFDSWDIVDQVSALFAATPYARVKIRDWSKRDEEFVKRAAFSLIAELAWFDKTMTDRQFEAFFPVITRASTDERNFVKKAVNWALRNIGKRNRRLNRGAVALAKKLRASGSPSARWIGAGALRELTSEAVQRRLAGMRPKPVL
jgi:3-methyladenine DNA glycosylase AlkD